MESHSAYRNLLYMESSIISTRPLQPQGSTMRYSVRNGKEMEEASSGTEWKGEKSTGIVVSALYFTLLYSG